MKKTLHERIAIIEARKARDQARLASMKGRQKKADRKRDDRRKILVGAIVMVEMEREPKFAAHIRAILGKALTRPRTSSAAHPHKVAPGPRSPAGRRPLARPR